MEKAKEQADEIIAEMKELLTGNEIADRDLFAARAKAKQLKNISFQQQDNDDEMIFTGDKVDFFQTQSGRHRLF